MSAPVSGIEVTSMFGLGDNVYQRPFIRAAASRGPVWVRTPWPELYDDLPGVRFARPTTSLRTQHKNTLRQPDTRWSEPHGARTVTFRYDAAHLKHGSIVDAMGAVLPLEGQPFVFDLPRFGPCPVVADAPLAVLRPATVRSEWRNPARNPSPEYMYRAGEILRDSGYHVVSVADLESGLEWLDGVPPPAHTVLHSGELSIADLLGLVQAAAVCVGGVGWLAPAAIASGTPLLVIGGGKGGHNAPEHVTDPRMDLTRVRWLMPDPYCRCIDSMHECQKAIPDFDARFTDALREVA